MWIARWIFVFLAFSGRSGLSRDDTRYAAAVSDPAICGESTYNGNFSISRGTFCMLQRPGRKLARPLLSPPPPPPPDISILTIIVWQTRGRSRSLARSINIYWHVDIPIPLARVLALELALAHTRARARVSSLLLIRRPRLCRTNRSLFTRIVVPAFPDYGWRVTRLSVPLELVTRPAVIRAFAALKEIQGRAKHTRCAFRGARDHEKLART